ncbi:MAG: hypothetical protein RIS64_2388 [Bacteroidota bacterium]
MKKIIFLSLTLSYIFCKTYRAADNIQVESCVDFKKRLSQHLFKGIYAYRSQNDSTYLTDVPLDSFVNATKICFQQLHKKDFQNLFPLSIHSNPKDAYPINIGTPKDTLCVLSFGYIYLLTDKRALDKKTMQFKHPRGYPLTIRYDCKTEKIIDVHVYVPDGTGLQ